MVISLVRTLLLYVIIILAVRIMGKRQISDLQTSELVVTLLISDVASIPMQNTAQPLVSGLIPMVILISCELVVSAAMLKSSRFRKFVCGKPVIIINDGKVDQNEMRRLRMSTEDLFEELRQANIFSISEVSYGIVETNGKLSVLKKSESQEVTNSALGISPTDGGLEVVVVSDGELAKASMAVCGVSEQWIRRVLAKQNTDLREVFIMTANKQKDFYIIKKEGAK